MRSWVSRFDLGRKVAAGGWLVSKVALAAFLDGNQEALQKYLLGDRQSPEVTSCFARLGLSHLLPAAAGQEG
jgi:hypothetical protein